MSNRRPEINPEYLHWLADICEEVGFSQFEDELILRDHNGKSYEIEVAIREISAGAVAVVA